MVIANDDGREAAHGLWFAGRPASGLRAWADLVVRDTGVLPDVAGALGPGSSLMVAYEGDQTERALRKRVPPAATPLGLAMLAAGCRWFKDWYYPEGWMEGGMKLQGNKPVSEEARAANAASLRAELEEWLAGTAGETGDDLLERARNRAARALEAL